MTGLPPGFSFQVTITGTPGNYTGTFVQNNFNKCVTTNVGAVTCDGTYMGLPAFTDAPDGPPQCAPANCLVNNECSQTPAPNPFTYQVTTQGTTKTLTTVSLPSSPLTTCTSQGKSNPITFVWSPM